MNSGQQSVRPTGDFGSSFSTHGHLHHVLAADSLHMRWPGRGQFVQVVDTGLDDASCWFRDNGIRSELTGLVSICSFLRHAALMLFNSSTFSSF